MSVVRSPVRSVVRSPVRSVLGSGALSSSNLQQLLALSPSLLIWPAEATMTQATNGTGAAPGTGDPVGRILDLSGNGNNLIAGTWASPADSSRALYGRVPLGGRRNLLTFTEDVTNAAWVKFNTTGTAADKVVETAVTNFHGTRQPSPLPGLIQTFQVSLKEAERRYAVVSFGGSNTPLHGGGIFVDLRTGEVLSFAGAKLLSHSAVSQGDGWWRYHVSVDMTGITETPAAFVWLIDNSTHTIGTVYGSKSYAGDGTSGILLREAQFELGSTPTAYQKVTDQYDVTEAGVADTYYLTFDGSDDYFSLLNAISITEDMTVVRAFKRASAGINSHGLGLAAGTEPRETSWTATNNITVGLGATAAGAANTTTGSMVTTARRSASTEIIRLNGTQVNTRTAPTVSGTFDVFGRIGSLYNSGEISFLAVFTSELTGAQLALVERIAAGTNGTVLA